MWMGTFGILREGGECQPQRWCRTQNWQPEEMETKEAPPSFLTSPGKKGIVKGEGNHPLTKESPGAYQSWSSSGKPFVLRGCGQQVAPYNGMSILKVLEGAKGMHWQVLGHDPHGHYIGGPWCTGEGGRNDGNKVCRNAAPCHFSWVPGAELSAFHWT